jgi:hypothetical protein
MIRLKRSLLIGAGSLAVGLGILGVLLPVLPTTPFLLLAAACYAKSSDRFYRWLMTNRYLGEYIRNYREGRGIPARTKAFTLTCLWATISFSALVVVEPLPVKIILFVIATCVSAHILTRPTYRPEPRRKIQSADVETKTV